MDSETFAQTIQLIHDACIRTLTIPEQQVSHIYLQRREQIQLTFNNTYLQFVQKAFKSHAFTVVSNCELSPEKLHDLVETNHILAMDVVPLFLEQVDDKE